MQISFPISVFLIPFAVFLIVLVFFIYFNLRNLIRYRAEDLYSFASLVIFLAGFAFIGYFSYEYLAPINWAEMINLNLEFRM